MNRIIIVFILILTIGLPAVSSGEVHFENGRGYDQFPIKRVSLYTSGLAWMVHETTVTDNEIVYFSVEDKDINDILKSLVLEDLDGGTVEAVNFDSEDPLSTILGDLRVNPSGSPTLVDFLLRTQGEMVSVTTPYGAFEGRIFSVEIITVNEGEKRVILNLMDDEGIKTIDISALQQLQFLDKILQKEMLSALDRIAQSRIKSSRSIKLSFTGTGTRRVRLSYIRAVPLWKTSYRIVLDEKGTPRLEGWALVQNTGSFPWKNIQLDFIAGQPNAFTMDMATPRYVTRQHVQPSIDTPLGATEYERGYASSPVPMPKNEMRSGSLSMMLAEPEALYEDDSAGGYYDKSKSYSPSPVASRAAGVRGGNFYRYEVKKPITVDSRSSAMIPIIEESEVGSTLGVYDPAYDLVLKGLRLANDTDAHWAAGPVSITEGRYYGGDALIPEMIPHSEQLITYAVHGTMDIQKTMKSEPQRIDSLRIVNGILHRVDKLERETEYIVEGTEKEVIIIHPKNSGWALTKNPEIDRETLSEYRFKIDNWEKPVIVSEEYLISRQVSLAGFRNIDTLTYIGWSGISTELKNAFEKMSTLLEDVSSIRNDISSADNDISRLERDQNRIRENIKVLEFTSDLYKQYSSQLAEQEKTIQELNRKINEMQNNLKIADEAFKDFIKKLDIS